MFEPLIADLINSVSLAVTNEPDEATISAIKMFRKEFRPIARQLSDEADDLTQAIIVEILDRRHRLQLGSTANSNRTIH